MDKDRTQAIDLIEAVDRTSPKMRTRSYDMSFNELAEMYRNEELIIHPEFQRNFRWSAEQQSRFIESLILELPIPPIFVIERDSGAYELIDGLQRLSSYLHFIGYLKAVRSGKVPSTDNQTEPPLILTGCDMVQELNDHTFESLPMALRIRLKRCFVRIEVVKKESRYDIGYHVFKRLNTGGEPLTDQEVRNCSIRLLDQGRFISFLRDLAANPDFVECMAPLSQEARDRRQDEEYVLRFFAFKNDRENFKHNVGEFMTSYAEKVASQDVPFDFFQEEDCFRRTFSTLRAILGQDVFCRFINKNGREISAGQLRPNYFEAFSLGIQAHLARINVNDPSLLGTISDSFIKLRFEPDFIKVTGAGVNYGGPLNARIQLVSNVLERVLDGTR